MYYFHTVKVKDHKTITDSRPRAVNKPHSRHLFNYRVSLKYLIYT